MRFYEIALFVFILNLALGLLNGFGVFDVGVSEHEGFGDDEISAAYEQVNSTIKADQESVFGDLNWLVENVRMVVQGLGIFVKALANATILLPALLTSLHVPGALVAVMSVMIYFIYTVGMVQFLMGRSIKEVE